MYQFQIENFIASELLKSLDFLNSPIYSFILFNILKIDFLIFFRTVVDYVFEISKQINHSFSLYRSLKDVFANLNFEKKKVAKTLKDQKKRT